MMPNTVAIVNGSTNPQAGTVVDYLLSDEVARALAESVSGNVPVKPSVAREYPDLLVPDPMECDLRKAAAEYPEAVTTCIEAIEAGSPDAAS